MSVPKGAVYELMFKDTDIVKKISAKMLAIDSTGVFGAIYISNLGFYLPIALFRTPSNLGETSGCSMSNTSSDRAAYRL